MDRTIVIEVNGSYIRKDSNMAGVTGEGNSRFMNIIFDESWLEYAKTVTFWDAKGENPVKRVLTTDYLTNPTVALNYTIPIPAEALTCQGKMTFVIDGSIEGARKRSVSDKLKVEYAPQADDANDPVDPTPSQFEQIQTQVDKILPDMIGERLQAQEARNEAVNAAEEATASAESASAASESAGVAMAAAVEAANVARDAEAGAVEAKEAAQKIKEEMADVAGGDFPTREEAQGYANQAEVNAKAYTDEQLAHIPTPDVSGQISEHNADADAHPAIRERINSLEEKVGDVVLSELDILDYEVVTKEEFDSMEKQEDVLYLIEDDPETQAVKEHIVNTDIHVTAEEKTKLNNAATLSDETKDAFGLDSSANLDDVLGELSGMAGAKYEKKLKTEIITESCNWIVPADIASDELFVLAFGGGGGGSGSCDFNTSPCGSGAGGGGGGHMAESVITVKAGGIVGIIIGDGGAGSTGGSYTKNGEAGGFTSVGSDILASGGEGGGGYYGYCAGGSGGSGGGGGYYYGHNVSSGGDSSNIAGGGTGSYGGGGGGGYKQGKGGNGGTYGGGGGGSGSNGSYSGGTGGTYGGAGGKGSTSSGGGADGTAGTNTTGMDLPFTGSGKGGTSDGYGGGGGGGYGGNGGSVLRTGSTAGGGGGGYGADGGNAGDDSNNISGYGGGGGGGYGGAGGIGLSGGGGGGGYGIGSIGGSGGKSSSSSVAAGGNGMGYASGGGGAGVSSSVDGNGGDGAPGVVILSYYVTVLVAE